MGLGAVSKRSSSRKIKRKICLRVRDIHGLEEFIDHCLHELGHLCVQYLRSCFLGQASTLISGLRRYVLLPRSCGADLEDHSARCGGCIEVGHPHLTKSSLSVAVTAWPQNVPEHSLSLSFDALFVSLFFTPSKGHAASMVRCTNV